MKNTANGNAKKKRRSQVGEIWRRLCKSKPAMISLAFIIFLILCAVFAPFIAPYDYCETGLGLEIYHAVLGAPAGYR